MVYPILGRHILFVLDSATSAIDTICEPRANTWWCWRMFPTVLTKGQHPTSKLQMLLAHTKKRDKFYTPQPELKFVCENEPWFSSPDHQRVTVSCTWHSTGCSNISQKTLPFSLWASYPSTQFPHTFNTPNQPTKPFLSQVFIASPLGTHLYVQHIFTQTQRWRKLTSTPGKWRLSTFYFSLVSDAQLPLTGKFCPNFTDYSRPQNLCDFARKGE